MAREILVTENFLNSTLELLTRLEHRALDLGHEELLLQIRIVKNNIIDAKLSQWYDAIDVDAEFAEQAVQEMRNRGAL
jgi:hypothetical protein